MFRALLAHRQEALHKQHLVYCVRLMSVGCATIAVSLTLYARNIRSAICVAPPEDEQVMLETCEGP
jgi:predicted alpha/beta hydrolase family esterase